jgi:hypothetical protein
MGCRNKLQEDSRSKGGTVSHSSLGRGHHKEGSFGMKEVSKDPSLHILLATPSLMHDVPVPASL